MAIGPLQYEGSRDPIVGRHTQQRMVLGSTNRAQLIAALTGGGARANRRRRNNSEWINNYQHKVVEEAKARGKALLERTLPTITGEVAEPYVPLENKLRALSYELDIKGDAAKSLNYVLKQIETRANRRSKRLFRTMAGNDSDMVSNEPGPLSPTTAAAKAHGKVNKATLSSAELVLANLPNNPSAICPPDDPFVTAWMAATGDRALDGSLQYKIRDQQRAAARMQRARIARAHLREYAAKAEIEYIEKDERYLQSKRRLQQAYTRRLHEQNLMTTSYLRKGLGKFNGVVIGQLEGKQTSLWGTCDAPGLNTLAQTDPPARPE